MPSISSDSPFNSVCRALRGWELPGTCPKKPSKSSALSAQQGMFTWRENPPPLSPQSATFGALAPKKGAFLMVFIQYLPLIYAVFIFYLFIIYQRGSLLFPPSNFFLPSNFFPPPIFFLLQFCPPHFPPSNSFPPPIFFPHIFPHFTQNASTKTTDS